jgi:hypothetical protein
MSVIITPHRFLVRSPSGKRPPVGRSGFPFPADSSQGAEDIGKVCHTLIRTCGHSHTARPRLGAPGAGLVALRLDSAANNPAGEGDSGQDVVDEIKG